MKENVVKLVTEEKAKNNGVAQEKMPIKAIPFKHQIKGYDLVCTIFGFYQGGDDNVSK